MYLVATYGVRRQQVSDLLLADIDWRERTIDFAAHKGGKAIHHTLTQSVAEALADYLWTERPTSDCEYVFLRQTSPYLRLGPPAITAVVRSRMARCGLPRRGPHALRHTFATRLLQAGESVKARQLTTGFHYISVPNIFGEIQKTRHRPGASAVEFVYRGSIVGHTDIVASNEQIRSSMQPLTVPMLVFLWSFYLAL